MASWRGLPVAGFESGSVCNTRTFCTGVQFEGFGTPRTFSNGLESGDFF
jgi:hypothetical protein